MTTLTVTDYCPYIDDENTIVVTFKKEFYPRHSSPIYIPMSFKCDYYIKCNCTNDCPIYRKIEANPEQFF